MKRIYLFFTIAGAIICSQNNRLFAQDKQVDFKLGSGGIIYNLTTCGDDDFFLVYGKQLLSKDAKKNIMKFDKNLQPVWKDPITITGATSGGIDIYSYTNPIDKTTIGYLFGAEQFLQVLSDGTTKAKKTNIPAKELELIVAVFTDVSGLNIITLNGAKEFPTGNMNWYIFSHDQLNMTKKNIILPLPSGIDKDNESEWWLNQVASDGLYFTYVSYKNKVKQPGSILSCNVVKVNSSGKPGNIINVDMNHDKYIILPAYYTQSLLLTAMPPIVSGTVWQHSSNFNVFRPYLKKYSSTIYADDAYLGVQVDGNNNRIYTVIGINGDADVDRDGIPGISGGKAYPIKSFEATTFDIAGKKINQSVVDFQIGPAGSQDNRDYSANTISLTLLQNNEGLICKAINNGKGSVFSVDKEGKVAKQNKFELLSYKQMTGQRYKDQYNAFYTTMKDFENSPYIKNIKSPEDQFLNKIDKKERPTVLYLSLKSGNLFANWDSKNELVKLIYFNKN